MSALLELPLSGDVQVYGDFAASNLYGFGVPVTISYTATGGYFPAFNLADQNNTFAEYIISIHVNSASIITYSCNGFEGGYHCGQANQYQPSAFVSSLDGFDGLLRISSSISYYEGGHILDPPPVNDPILVNLRLFATLPDGFSLAPPVPEPATWVMMLLGFACVGIVSFHRKWKSNAQGRNRDVHV